MPTTSEIAQPFIPRRQIILNGVSSYYLPIVLEETIVNRSIHYNAKLHMKNQI